MVRYSGEIHELFTRGLIHLAVGFYHILERENPKGALRQLNKGVTKLKEYMPEFQGVEIEKLLDKAMKCIKEIEKIKSKEVESFDNRMIPRIEFNPKRFK